MVKEIDLQEMSLERAIREKNKKAIAEITKKADAGEIVRIM